MKKIFVIPVLTDEEKSVKKVFVIPVLADEEKPAKKVLMISVLTDEEKPVKKVFVIPVLTDEEKPVKKVFVIPVLTDEEKPVKKDFVIPVLTDEEKPQMPITTDDSDVDSNSPPHGLVYVQISSANEKCYFCLSPVTCHLAVKHWAHETKSTLRTEPTRAVNDAHGVANEQAVPSVGKQCTLRYISF